MLLPRGLLLHSIILITFDGVSWPLSRDDEGDGDNNVSNKERDRPMGIDFKSPPDEINVSLAFKRH